MNLQVAVQELLLALVLQPALLVQRVHLQISPRQPPRALLHLPGAFLPPGLRPPRPVPPVASLLLVPVHALLALLVHFPLALELVIAVLTFLPDISQLVALAVTPPVLRGDMLLLVLQSALFVAWVHIPTVAVQLLHAHSAPSALTAPKPASPNVLCAPLDTPRSSAPLSAQFAPQVTSHLLLDSVTHALQGRRVEPARSPVPPVRLEDIPTLAIRVAPRVLSVNSQGQSEGLV